MGPARYGDLNSDLPVCTSTSITQESLLIQSVTSLPIHAELNKTRIDGMGFKVTIPGDYAIRCYLLLKLKKA